MKAVALAKAGDHLELAEEAAKGLTLDGGFKLYERAWSEFLSQVSRFYSKLEQGAKGTAKSEGWFGHKKGERSDDPLLSYLHQARNADEHGLDYITAKGADCVNVHMTKDVKEIHVAFDMMVDKAGRVHVRDPKTNTPEAVDHFELINPRVELVTVKNRGHSFDPPNMHLGKPIVENGPPSVAKLAISYLRDMLDEASKLPEFSEPKKVGPKK